MNIIDIKGNLHDEGVLNVISYSVYMPTRERLNSLADKYESEPDVFAFAAKESNVICGVVVIKRVNGETFEIKSIATDPCYRNAGVASKLLTFAVEIQKCMTVTAETDDDAVGFYRKYGFQVESLGEKYPGIVRYLCTLKLK